MSKLRDVINFEVQRNLKKKSFWFTSLMPPILIMVVMGISIASSNSAQNTSQQQANTISKSGKVAILDETGLIDKQQLTKLHIITESTKQAGIAAVQGNQIDAFLYYPKDVSKNGIAVYAQDQGINFSSSYSTAATQLLKEEVIAQVHALTKDSQIPQLLRTDPAVTTTTYKNGVQTNGLASIIAPGLCMLAFLSLVVLMSYLMMTSTTEEKENRAAEMLLTAIRSRTLITGKILSIFVLGLVQILVIIVPLVIAYIIFKSHLTLPGSVSLSHIPLNPKTVTFGILFAASGLIMFTGFLVGLSALFPSAQEAGRYLGIAIVTQFLPIYTLAYIISSPHTLIVSIFTYFPLTAPTTGLLRNTAGTLSLTQSLISLAIIVASATLTMLFAIRAFRYGAMEYGRKVGIKELFR